ncbi:CKLF-like MARVEL transmembrane domain-containing protein 6 [Solea solea]|uniref:CKLF-like MARVEL transmembrane domain-containing protein 6 n=1 Tax=Solea solea TaxID=90069 RepID=UPI0027299CD2|nr:CKLF-like MARVEL transmembrane domain-containing protein 6 [Solea solea]XP_058504792.1 CKLF-like MARVEL transmembrane domain-containing protein 6 [Solea solea]
MASEVYSPTTAPNPTTSWCLIPSEHLDQARFVVKLTQVLFSSVAFLLEEVVSSCSSCFALYFFEFVTCTAFLFTLLLLILLSTSLHATFGITCWPSLDFCYTAAVAVLFFVSSIIFASDNNGSTLEKSAVAFGFLATLAFVVDVVIFYKRRGFPFLSGGKAESSNGGPVTAEAPAEKERLNADGE